MSSKLRKQIKESFLNPVLHLFPLLLFLLVDEAGGMLLALKVAFPVAFVLLLYVFYNYNRIFTWHLIFTLVFVVLTLIAFVELHLHISKEIHQVLYEVVVIAFLVVFFSFRKPIQKQIRRVVPRIVPMTNNFEEMYRFCFILLIVLMLYVTGNALLRYSSLPHRLIYLGAYSYIYFAIMIFVMVYEHLRVRIIRTSLLKEEWWPILNESGKIIGSTQHLTSLNDNYKYMHPVARVAFVENGLILLQKRSPSMVVFPGKWDMAISNHVKMEETVDNCIERTAKERYNINHLRYMYLANYTLEVPNEHHYVFFFVSCQEIRLYPDIKYVEQTKWWTTQQIEENLKAGIFTDNFIAEYEILKRSGLLQTGVCDCDCRLKQVVYRREQN